MSKHSIARGDEQVAKAKKALKTGWLKWKPEWEEACTRFREAVKCYRAAGEDAREQLLAALLESVECNEKTNSSNACAQITEQAAGILVELGKVKEAYEQYERSAVYYRINSQSDKAAAVRIKGATLIVKENPDKAIKTLSDACQVFEDENRGMLSADCFKKSISLACEYERFDDAIKFIRRQNVILLKLGEEETNYLSDVYRNLLGLLVIEMHRQDYKKAQETFDQSEMVAKFSMSEEWEAGNALLAAMGNGSMEDLKEAVKKKEFRYLPNRLARLARTLQLTEEVVLNPPGPKQELTIDAEGNITGLGDEDEEEKEPPVDSDGELDFR